MATTPTQSAATSPLVRLIVVTVLALMLAVGAFAVGRTTASESSGQPTIVAPTASQSSGLAFPRRPHPLLRRAVDVAVHRSTPFRRQRRWVVREDLAMRGRPSGARFVGRADELAQLDEAIARLRASEAGGLLVTGEPGIGKSRLVEELCARATDAGAVVGVGYTSPGGDVLAYGTMVSLLRDLSGRLDADDALRGDEVRRRLLGEGAADGNGRLEQLVLLEEVLAYVVHLASIRPVVLVFEDLHWADAGSAGAVDHLVRNLHDVPVLLVATYRPVELDVAAPIRTGLAELRKLRSITTIELEGLDREAIALLLADIAGTTPSWTVVDAVHRRSEGNPFFAEELISVTDHHTVPPALGDLLSVRIEALDDAPRRLVGAAAVLGEHVDHQLLAKVFDAPDDELDAALGAAVRAGVLTLDALAGGLRFRHALLREVADASLLPTERVRFHIRAAEAIEESGPGQSSGIAAAIAEHRYRAGHWAAACTASLRAAETSLAVYEVYAADAHLTRAVEAHARAGGRCTHAEGDADIFGDAAAVAYLVGAFDRAMRLAERALEILDPSEAPGATAAVTTTYALAAASAGFTQPAFAVLDRIADDLSTTDDTAAQAEVACTQARVYMSIGRVLDSNRFAYRALELARQAERG